MQTARRLTLSVLALATLTACQDPRTSAVSETELAQCVEWQRSLPTRSSKDTAETIEDIGYAYDIFEAVCAPVLQKRRAR